MSRDDDRLGKGRITAAEQPCWQTSTAVATGIAARTVITLPQTPVPGHAMRRYRSSHGEAEGDGQTSRNEDRLGKGAAVATAEQPVQQSPIAVGVSVRTANSRQWPHADYFMFHARGGEICMYSRRRPAIFVQ